MGVTNSHRMPFCIHLCIVNFYKFQSTFLAWHEVKIPTLPVPQVDKVSRPISHFLLIKIDIGVCFHDRLCELTAVADDECLSTYEAAS